VSTTQDRYEKEHQKIELRKTLDQHLGKFDSLVTEILRTSNKKVPWADQERPIPEPVFRGKIFDGKNSVSEIISFSSRMFHSTIYEAEVKLTKPRTNQPAEAVLRINLEGELPTVYSKAIYEAARRFPDSVEMGSGRKYQIVITQSTVGFRL